MIGFEVEVAVPTFGREPTARDPRFANGPDGKPPALEIEQFLLEGLDCGTECGSSASVGIKTDRDDLYAKSREITTALHRIGYAPEPANEGVSNLEYVTVAFDEFSDGCEQLMRIDAAEIRTHLAKVMATQLRITAVPAPATGLYTGFPGQAFERWLADAGTRGKEVRRALLAFRESVNDECHLQATAGILPSALPRLFRSTIQRPPLHWGHAGLHYAIAMVDIMIGDPGFAHHPYVTAMRSDHLCWDSFVGLLYLVATYLTGNALNQTDAYEGSSYKNAVPLWLKMPLSQVRSQCFPHPLREEIMPADLFGFIQERFTKRIAGFSTNYWLERSLGVLRDRRAGMTADGFVVRRPIVASPVEFLRAALVGDVDIKEQSVLEPDTPPRAIREASGFQLGVPLEFRWLPSLEGPADLEPAFISLAHQTRLWNVAGIAPQAGVL